MEFELEGLEPNEIPRMIAMFNKEVTEQVARQADCYASFIETLSRLGDEYKDALQNLATERQWQKYLRLHRRRLRLIRNLRLEVSASKLSATRLIETRRENIMRSLEIFEKEGIDCTAIRELQLTREQKSIDAYEKLLGVTPPFPA